MAIVYSDTIKNARLTIVRDALDVGIGAGKLQIGSFGFADVLVEVPFTAVSGTVAGGVLTFSTPVIEPIASVDGTASEARLVTGSGVIVASGLTVGIANSDVQLNSVVIVATQPVTITSATLTHG